MYREIAVPTQYGDHRISIIPNSKYLMITLEKDNFYQMDQDEYNTCLKTKKKVICWIRHPIYNTLSNQSRCERDLLARKSVFSQFCKFQVTPEMDVWIQLQQRNNWIYGVKQELTLNVICEKEVFDITLQGSGLLELQPGCEIVQPDMTITAESRKRSEGTVNFNPTLNLSPAVINNEFQLSNLTIDHTQQLREIHSRLKDVRDQAQVERYHHVSHHTANVGFLIILIICSIATWMIRHKIKTVYNTMMMTTSDVSETIWRQWRLSSRRQLRSGTSNTNQNNDGVREIDVEPLHGSRGENVQVKIEHQIPETI